MVITHVVENLNRGGLERAVIDLVRAQVALGHRCQVVCLFGRGLLADELEAIGVAVHACEKRRGIDVRAMRRLRHLMRDHATHVLHTHNATAHYHAVAAAIGLPIRCTVNTRHGMGALDTGSRRERLYRLTMGRTDAVVTVCDAARRELAASGALPSDKLIVIPNGIRVGCFATADASARAALVAELGLPAATRVIGTVGRLNWAKDHASLIRAFAALLRSDGQCALVIVGDGSLRTELQALVDSEGVTGRVFLLGDRSDVAECLRGFDVFVLSSLTEGYSIALLEACAAGLPIVATDVGGNREIVRDGVNGLVVAARAPAQLRDALSRLLADKPLAASMGQASREWVLGEGSVAKMAGHYGDAYAAFGR